MKVFSGSQTQKITNTMKGNNKIAPANSRVLVRSSLRLNPKISTPQTTIPKPYLKLLPLSVGLHNSK